MSSNDKDKQFDELFQDECLQKEFPILNSPFFAHKVIAEVRRQTGVVNPIFSFLQSKYTYWVLFLGLVLFPALAEANSLRSLCFY